MNLSLSRSRSRTPASRPSSRPQSRNQSRRESGVQSSTSPDTQLADPKPRRASFSASWFRRESQNTESAATESPTLVDRETSPQPDQGRRPSFFQRLRREPSVDSDALATLEGAGFSRRKSIHALHATHNDVDKAKQQLEHEKHTTMNADCALCEFHRRERIKAEAVLEAIERQNGSIAGLRDERGRVNYRHFNVSPGFTSMGGGS